ncbi:p-hydroxybenzoic acid efflux pump subunit AaeA [Marinomonas gallaica]|uniref:p-hydroxybenzoic acid efflux pump subunit AaeA n=1 Tax=Marinomonas gallaica TaxID=1806667 RepID=A0A1C3JPR3_9GAMM|nr:HlyD family secretion protein [Marinomonas gallaica]SBT17126.1 p-hydroxybenzoic acid efflux pump subunit AaeA [Marinomonas gallaica]SBT19461.1 p-hydroxybenzoic acid efflux pump subunit AaeA [Marinomonas gallaica]
MKHSLRVALTVAVVLLAILAGYWIWQHYLYSPWTRDGRVRAEVITIAPDVSGWVTSLNVTDNQEVKQGDVILNIDDARARTMVEQLEAQVAGNQYALELAQHQYERRRQLSQKEQLVSDETIESARITVKQAEATLKLSQAKLNAAKLDVERSQVTAPQDGYIVNLNLREGNYVSQGKPVLSLVKKGSLYVTGYFEETKLPMIHVGQQANVHLMSGGQPLTGKVTSIGRAIADSNTTSNGQLLPQVQQTFNWVRLAQRIPVDIELDPFDGVQLSAGMSATIHLATE